MNTQNSEQIAIVALIIFFEYALVFLAVILDLIAGLKKAKQRGEARLSEALRRTGDKLGRYYVPLFGLTVADAMQICAIWYLDTYWHYNIPIIPIMTLIGSLGFCAIEIKSIFEKAEDKAKYIKVGKLAGTLFRNKEDATKLIDAISDYLENKEPIDEQRDETNP
ncbi:MAG: hypothetical protein QM660_06085 [Dysgonomonas sp.]